MHWLDPDYLPATTGTVKQFLINPHGDADGFILGDGSEVHFPPHMSSEVQSEVSPGDAVTIRGVKPRGADLIAAVAIDTANGRRIDDNGPPDDEEEKHGKHHGKPKHEDVSYSGMVVRALHGPKGEVRGALFESGLTIRFPKHEADGVMDLITPGVFLAVQGKGLKTPLGTVIDAKEIGPSLRELQPIKNKKPKHHKDKRHDEK